MNAQDVKHLLGFYDNKIIFLDHDLWICSIDLAAVNDKFGGDLDEVTNKHFFIPMDYVGGSEWTMSCVSSKGFVIFPKEGKVVVVRKGLK